MFQCRQELSPYCQRIVSNTGKAGYTDLIALIVYHLIEDLAGRLLLELKAPSDGSAGLDHSDTPFSVLANMNFLRWRRLRHY